MVGISLLVLQTTFKRQKKGQTPKENNRKGLGIPTGPWDPDLVVP